jgi:hypothetical protein
MQQIFYPIMATKLYYFYKCFKSITPIYLGTSVSLVGQRELSLHSDAVSIKATLTVITINHFRWNREWKEGLIKWNIITSLQKRCVLCFSKCSHLSLLSHSVLLFFIFSISPLVSRSQPKHNLQSRDPIRQPSDLPVAGFSFLQSWIIEVTHPPNLIS